MTATSTGVTGTSGPFPAHRIAMWAFLVNEGLLFGSILAAGLFLKFGGTAPWPPPGDALPIGGVTFATLLLIASSATFNESLDALRRGNLPFSRRWLVWTLLAGSLFLAVQAYEWVDLQKAARAVAPEGSSLLLANPWGGATFIQVFALATGLHALHVLLGLALMAWLLATATHDREARLESVALYWHFVDFVWIFIVCLLYLT